MMELQGVVRLTRHHMEVVDVNMHPLCQALGKQIRNLRSQVARNACLAASELFCTPRKSLETELEEASQDGRDEQVISQQCQQRFRQNVNKPVQTKSGPGNNYQKRRTSERHRSIYRSTTAMRPRTKDGMREGDSVSQEQNTGFKSKHANARKNRN